MTEATARRRYRKLENDTKDGLILIDPSGDRKGQRSLIEPDEPIGTPPANDPQEQDEKKDDGQPRLL